jgi:F-type H+-transporting ATPase subunit delta
VEEIAQVYARALFEVAEEADALDRIHDELGQFGDALAEDRDLQVFFFSPYFSSNEKKDGIGKVLDGAEEHFQNFLELLVERHRLPAIFRIRRAFDERWAEEKRLLPVSVTSAVELDDKLVKQIGDEIQEQTGQDVQLTSEVDPDVLGGLVVRVGNMILDASLRTRLETLRKQVAKTA